MNIIKLQLRTEKIVLAIKCFTTVRLTLSLELMKLFQFTFLLSIDIFDFLGFGQLESRSRPRIHHLGRETKSFSKMFAMKRMIPVKNNSSPLTWFQFFFDPCGSFFQRFTRSTQALQMSPTRSSDRL